MPSPQATPSLSPAAATAPTAAPGSKRLRMVHAGPGRAKDRPNRPFHESARLGMLGSPTGSDMATTQRRFLDRVEAGELLAGVLAGLVRPPVVVLGIPRGGVVVAARVAARLGAPLDVVVPRKVGAPGNPELAVGAGRLLHPPGRRRPGPGGRARRPARPGRAAVAGRRPGGGAGHPGPVPQRWPGLRALSPGRRRRGPALSGTKAPGGP